MKYEKATNIICQIALQYHKTPQQVRKDILYAAEGSVPPAASIELFPEKKPCTGRLPGGELPQRGKRGHPGVRPKGLAMTVVVFTRI